MRAGENPPRGGNIPNRRNGRQPGNLTYGRTLAQIFLRGTLAEAAADRQNAPLQAVLDVLVSLDDATQL